MSKQKKSSIKTVVVMIIFAAVILTGFYYVANNTDSKEEEVKIPTTEVEKIIAKDLEVSYPASPREVLKLYSRISKAFYDGKYDDKQFQQLVEQYLLLLDDELIGKNQTKEAYVKKLRKEIESYKKDKKSITSYIIEETSATKYSTIKEKECASLNVAFMLKKDNGYEKIYEKFLFRQDEQKRWKIVGWGSAAKKDVAIE